jgi:hypothetical protein
MSVPATSLLGPSKIPERFDLELRFVHEIWHKFAKEMESAAEGWQRGSLAAGWQDWEKFGIKVTRLGEVWQQGDQIGRSLAAGWLDWAKFDSRVTRLGEVWQQGDQIGRIFAHWAIVYTFSAVCWKWQKRRNFFGLLFSLRHRLCIKFDKKGLAIFLATFSQTHLLSYLPERFLEVVLFPGGGAAIFFSKIMLPFTGHSLAVLLPWRCVLHSSIVYGCHATVETEAMGRGIESRTGEGW